MSATVAARAPIEQTATPGRKPPRKVQPTTARAGLEEHVRRVREAQRSWAEVPVRGRLGFVRALRRLIVARREHLCEAAREDLGKSATDTLGGDLLPQLAHRLLVLENLDQPPQLRLDRLQLEDFLPRRAIQETGRGH